PRWHEHATSHDAALRVRVARRGGHGLLRRGKERKLGAVKRAALAALLVLGACQRSPAVTPDTLFAAATDQLQHGELSEALKLTTQGIDLSRGNPSSVDAWRFRLLRTEIFLLQRQADPDVGPSLTASLPDTAAFAPLRARQ